MGVNQGRMVSLGDNSKKDEFMIFFFVEHLGIHDGLLVMDPTFKRYGMK